MKHKIKPGLLPRIIIAIAMGIAIGWISPEWFARLCATFNDIFSQFLGFLIPLIIVGFVTPAIGDIGIRAGKMLIVTLLLAYGATLFRRLYILLYLSIWLFPSMISQDSAMTAVEQGGTTIEPYFTVGMPPLMGVMTALVSSFVIGLGIAVTSAEVLGQRSPNCAPSSS